MKKRTNASFVAFVIVPDDSFAFAPLIDDEGKKTPTRSFLHSVSDQAPFDRFRRTRRGKGRKVPRTAPQPLRGFAGDLGLRVTPHQTITMDKQSSLDAGKKKVRVVACEAFDPWCPSGFRII
jgi:hypothetical protein